jgi:hypothetical protein
MSPKIGWEIMCKIYINRLDIIKNDEYNSLNNWRNYAHKYLRHIFRSWYKI